LTGCGWREARSEKLLKILLQKPLSLAGRGLG